MWWFSRPSDASALTSYERLTLIKELVENTNPETEGFNRNTLIDAMEHSGKIQIRWKPEWRESEAPDTEPGERLGVSTARQAVRNYPGRGVLGQQRSAHGRDQLAVESGLQRNVAMDELTSNTGTEQAIKLGQELLLVPGQETSVHLGRGDLWYNIDFIPSTQHCRISCIPQGRTR